MLAAGWLVVTDCDLGTGPRFAWLYVALSETAVDVVGMTCVISSEVACHEAKVSLGLGTQVTGCVSVASVSARCTYGPITGPAWETGCASMTWNWVVVGTTAALAPVGGGLLPGGLLGGDARFMD